MLLLDPKLKTQGGDIKGGAQVGGVGGGVCPLKTKVCNKLLVNHPTHMRSHRRLGES